MVGNYCNFTLEEHNKTISLKQFSKNVFCERPPPEKSTRKNQDALYKNYSNAKDLRIIKGFVEILLDKKNILPISVGGCCFLNGRKRNITIHEQSNTCTVMVNREKVDLQIGGAISYKGISFMADTLVNYISKTILQPVRTLQPIIEQIQIMFDEFNELSRNGNKYVLIIYDCGEVLRSYFKIETTLLLKACYAEEQIFLGKESVLTPDEKYCRNQLSKIYETHAKVIKP